MNEPIDDLEPAIERLRSAAERQTGRDICPELRDAMNASAEVSTATHRELRIRVAQLIGTISSPTGAGMLAVWLGSAVEAGADPEETVGTLLDAFSERVEFLSESVSDTDDAELSVDEELDAGLEFLGQGLVAHLVRCPERQLEAGRDELLMERLELVSHLSAGLFWVEALLKQRSGQLVVLHAEQRKGVRVSYRNLNNCFHLFTLLQAALAEDMPGGKQPDPQTVAVATGRVYDDVNDSACWHYGQPTSPSPNIVASVFGEASVDSIAEIDGEQVLLLWSPILQSRSWDGGFLAAPITAANPSVTLIANLSDDEVSRWYYRLSLEVEKQS